MLEAEQKAISYVQMALSCINYYYFERNNNKSWKIKINFTACTFNQGVMTRCCGLLYKFYSLVFWNDRYRLESARNGMHLETLATACLCLCREGRVHKL